MSTSPLDAALAGVPATFRGRIIKAYLELKARSAEAKHDAAGVSAGKLCETVVRLIQHELTGAFTPFGQQINNMAKVCEQFAQTPTTSGNDSLRLVLPKAISLVFTLRNKRGIGHVGGDVDANPIDGATIARVSDWILCEMIRMYHTMSLEEAEALVSSLAERSVPDVWDVGGTKRVLRNDLSYPEKTLLLLYASTQPTVLVEDLYEWTKYSDLAMYRSNVLRRLDDKNMILYNVDEGSATISPLGIKEVEEEILSTASNSSRRAKPKKKRIQK
ncbi:hypothetical protein ACU4GH_22585 [Bradyrhizobium betae]